MGSEMQPVVIRAQNREIQIKRVTKILYLVLKKICKLILKHKIL
jgi:hypothetical protein